MIGDPDRVPIARNMIIEHLQTQNDLASLRARIGLDCSIPDLRATLVSVARQALFLDDLLHDVPEPLLPAARALWDRWFIAESEDRDNYRRMRRTVQAIDRLRGTYHNALVSTQAERTA